MFKSRNFKNLPSGEVITNQPENKENIYASEKIKSNNQINRNNTSAKYSIYLLKDRNWFWDYTDKFDYDSNDVSLIIPVQNKTSKILIGYEEGRLARFRTRTFLNRPRKKIQKNTFSLRKDSNIIFAKEIELPIWLLACSIYDGDEYYKIFSSDLSGDVRESLSSQGTYFLPSDNDGVKKLEQIKEHNFSPEFFRKLKRLSKNRGEIISGSTIAEKINEFA